MYICTERLFDFSFIFNTKSERFSIELTKIEIEKYSSTETIRWVGHFAVRFSVNLVYTLFHTN